jgi:hypothetical protein
MTILRQIRRIGFFAGDLMLPNCVDNPCENSQGYYHKAMRIKARSKAAAHAAMHALRPNHC